MITETEKILRGQEIENNGIKESLFLALLTGKGLFTTVRVCCY